jgi:hypothetical protein
MLPGDGHGGFALGGFINVGKRPYQRLRSADLNGDGKADIVTTNLDGESVTILLGDGHGGFHEAPGSPVKTAPAPWAVEIADVNRDGKLDLVIIPGPSGLSADEMVVYLRMAARAEAHNLRLARNAG